ncbi:MAG TPA: BON domain-containing protein [Leptolyngbyaceae cyanobacterium]
MNSAKKNPADRERLDALIYESDEKEQASETLPELDALVNLLYELNILKRKQKPQPELAPYKQEDTINHPAVIDSELIEGWENSHNSASQAKEEVENLSENPLNSSAATKDKNSTENFNFSVELAESISNSIDNIDEDWHLQGNGYRRQEEIENANGKSSLLNTALETSNLHEQRQENSAVEHTSLGSVSEDPLKALFALLSTNLTDTNVSKSEEAPEQKLAIDDRQAETPVENGSDLTLPLIENLVEIDRDLTKLDRLDELENQVIEISKLEDAIVEKNHHQQTKSEVQEENVEELYDAYKRLQSLLIGPELGEFESLITNVEQKVKKVETQINDPTELINLLLPVISELLSKKIAESPESKESITEAMIPIVDELIKGKTQENREAMGKAIANALPIAITEQVRNNPEEFAKAIAPDIAAAIKEQIRLKKQAMVEALYPIIHEVIESKRQEDIDAISAAIAPLLPPAISEQIRNSPQEIAQAIGPEMAAAIREQVRLDRDAMIEALAPEMGKTIKAQIEIERDAMVDALYPVIGSTISKYMADVVRTINEKIETTLSMEGFNRKLRARMQGVSEAELILKEAVPFTIRAVFLIHKHSGLVISEAQNASKQKLESEMVAGMLTAIRSFVNDCIAQSGDVSEIDAIDYGNSKIILEVAGYCYLAAVTQGETPQWFIYRTQQSLYSIVECCGDAIENYQGDPSVIPENVNQILENLTNIQRKKEKKKTIPAGLLIVGSVLASLTLIPWGYYQYHREMDNRIEEETALALASAPELAVYRLAVEVNQGKVELAGKLPNEYLRQRAEQIAQKVAATKPLENKIIAVEVPPDPVLVASEVKRVTSILNQTNGVTISSSYAGGKVTVEGKVTQVADSRKITQAFQQIPGVKTVSNTVQLQQLSLPVRIYFDAASAELKPGTKKEIAQVKTFLNRYPETNLRIIGHSDLTGDYIKNQQLALARAEKTRQALIQQGVDPRRLEAVATPNPPLGLDSRQPLWLSRCVQFQPVSLGVKPK